MHHRADQRIRKIFSCIFRLLLAYGFVAALPAAFADEPNARIFAQANAFFQQAHAANNPRQSTELYEKALLRYEELSRHLKNGWIYYNIGNTYCELKDLGRAIVNYRRAEKLLPHDRDLAQNLAYALKQRQDAIPQTDEQRLLETLLFWNDDLDRPTKLLLFSASYVLCWLTAGLLLLPPWRGRLPRWPAGILLTLILCLSVSMGLARFRKNHAAGVIVASEVTARQGDGPAYQPSFTAPLHAGTEFQVVDRRPEWLRVKLSDGRMCWLPAQSCELI